MKRKMQENSEFLQKNLKLVHIFMHKYEKK